MLSFDKVDRRYNKRKPAALTSFTAGLDLGLVGVLGANGAGKSTLIRIAATVDEPDRGDVRFQGESLADRKVLRRYRSLLGYLPQDFSFDPGFTVNDVLHYMAWLKELPKSDVEDCVVRALAVVELADSARTRVRQLSGGMRQRLGLAQALLGDPRVLILDEPTVGLDPRQRKHFREALSTVATNSLVLLSTHLVEDIAVLADRVLVMDSGSLRFDGPVPALAARGGGTSDRLGSLERGLMQTLEDRVVSA